MTIRETYAKLKSVNQLKRRIWRLEQQRDELQLCMLPAAVRYDKDIVQATPENALERVAVEVVDLEREIDQAKRRRAKLMITLSRAIEQLPDERDKQIIVGYYFRGWSLRQLSEELHYNFQYVSQLKKTAIARLSHLL